MGLNLWVDDLRDPSRFVHGDWVWCKTITEAIRILATQQVEVVSIDHDIMHTIPSLLPSVAQSHLDTGTDADKDIIKSLNNVLHIPTACPENYTAVAYYLRAMPEEHRPWKVIIHSANPTGAKTISDILGDSIKVISIRMAHEINTEQMQ